MAEDQTATTDEETVEDRRQHIKRSQEPDAAAAVEGDVEFPEPVEGEEPARQTRRRKKARK